MEKERKVIADKVEKIKNFNNEGTTDVSVLLTDDNEVFVNEKEMLQMIMNEDEGLIMELASLFTFSSALSDIKEEHAMKYGGSTYISIESFNADEYYSIFKSTVVEHLEKEVLPILKRMTPACKPDEEEQEKECSCSCIVDGCEEDILTEIRERLVRVESKLDTLIESLLYLEDDDDDETGIDFGPFSF